MAPIGKAMLRGTYQQMAHKMWQHKILRMEFVKYLLRAIAAECSELCSSKTASMSRRCSSDDMLKFHPEALCEEWMERAPLFYSILMSSALSGRRKDVKTVTWLPSVALAGSVLLRERSRGMNAMQLLVTTIIKSSGSQVAYLHVFSPFFCCVGSVRITLHCTCTTHMLVEFLWRRIIYFSLIHLLYDWAHSLSALWISESSLPGM